MAEILEVRQVLSATAVVDDFHPEATESEFHTLPLPPELMAEPFVQLVEPPSGTEGTSTLLAAPIAPALHSNVGATVSLYLDFDGHFEAQWGGWSNVVTPAFDTDGNAGSFSSGELSIIQQVWQRVA
ncbi:MAG: hypothetical protein AB7O26_08910 [Planctomycetaceae bacterium]